MRLLLSLHQYTSFKLFRQVVCEYLVEICENMFVIGDYCYKIFKHFLSIAFTEIIGYCVFNREI